MISRNSLLSLSLFGLVIYCSYDPEYGSAELNGEWQLIEIKDDLTAVPPEFRPVDSDKIISFLENGSVNSNGSLCEPSEEVTENGTQAFNNDTISAIEVEGCEQRPGSPKTIVPYEIQDLELILNYEGNLSGRYQEKYIKINPK